MTEYAEHLRIPSDRQTPDDVDAVPVDPDRLSAIVRECVALMRSGGIARLELEYGPLRLRLRAHDPFPSGAPVAPPPAVMGSQQDAQPEVPDGYVIIAPMIGTFYHSSAPGEPPFVAPGDHIEEGQTIGIIEAMKIMNEIAADRSGTVVEILAGNGQTVEYGSPLIRLAPDP